MPEQPPTLPDQGAMETRAAAGVLTAAFVAAILALIAFAWLAHAVFRGDAQQLDVAVRNAIHQYSFPGLALTMRAISFLGSFPFLAAATVLLAIGLAYLARWPRAAGFLLLTMTGDVVLESALKHLFQRARPEAFFGIPQPLTYSFPSGHAMGSLCFYGVLAGLIVHRVRNFKLRVALGVGAACVVALIGFSRIYLGVHYLTDVLAGYAAAAVWVGAILTVDDWRRRRRVREP